MKLRHVSTGQVLVFIYAAKKILHDVLPVEDTTVTRGVTERVGAPLPNSFGRYTVCND